MLLLAGDIGGTHTRLRLVAVDADQWRTVREQHFPSGEQVSLDPVLRQFLTETAPGTIRAACLAVAGPVQRADDGETVAVTNLPWRLDSRTLAATFAIPRLRLINDFEAIGYGVPRLAPAELAVVQQGTERPGRPRAVIGAGTGLGQAIVLSVAGRDVVVSTEGGHVGFAPVDALQSELLEYLRAGTLPVSYEHVLSGPGLVRLYLFMRARGTAPEQAAIAEAMRREDPAAVISRAALEQRDRLCESALDLFVRIYGAQAGNLALSAGATGGVFVAGGIAARIVERLTDGVFRGAFCDKGPMRGLLETIPVRVVTNPGVGLLGATAGALDLALGREA